MCPPGSFVSHSLAQILLFSAASQIPVGRGSGLKPQLPLGGTFLTSMFPWRSHGQFGVAASSSFSNTFYLVTTCVCTGWGLLVLGSVSGDACVCKVHDGRGAKLPQALHHSSVGNQIGSCITILSQITALSQVTSLSQVTPLSQVTRLWQVTA